MRGLIRAAISMVVLLNAPAAWANSPSLTVPTFSLEIVDYATYTDVVGEGPAAISLISTSLASTSISLDSYVDILKSENSGYPASISEVHSTLHFEAADGYRITGISLSSTVQGILEVPVVTNPDAISVTYGASTNVAHAYGGYRSHYSQPPQLFEARNVTTPVVLDGIFQNTNNLRAFDFGLDIFATSYVEATYIFLPDAQDGKVWGYANLSYTDAVLTVHTEAVSPVPEPGQWGMLLIGMSLILAARRAARR